MCSVTQIGVKHANKGQHLRGLPAVSQQADSQQHDDRVGYILRNITERNRSSIKCGTEVLITTILIGCIIKTQELFS